jgi:hypothetical protein
LVVVAVEQEEAPKKRERWRRSRFISGCPHTRETHAEVYARGSTRRT